jgi:hypothetical protein
MRIFLSLLTIVSSLSVLGQNKTFFPALTKISIDTTYDVTFGYDKKSTRLINKPCYLLNKKDPLHCEKDEVLAEWKLVAKFRSVNFKDSLSIVYSEGMSADPGFVIVTKADKNNWSIFLHRFLYQPLWDNLYIRTCEQHV